MPVGGLSLLGFMEQQLAMHYLNYSCVFPDKSAAALLQHWLDARSRLGSPHPYPGQPDIQDLLPARNAYLTQAYLTLLAQHPRLVQPAPVQWSFKLVEIAPLLAFQFHVVTEHRYGELPQPPQVADTLPRCLPLQLESCKPEITRGLNSVVIKDANLNFRVLNEGPIAEDAPRQLNYYGVIVGPGGPWVTVTRFNGRCYLSNGYHRAYEIQKAGGTHIPCMLIDVPEFGGVGARGGGATFERALLESPNPPTCGHFTNARAYEVILKRMSRLIHVQWMEYWIPED